MELASTQAGRLSSVIEVMTRKASCVWCRLLQTRARVVFHLFMAARPEMELSSSPASNMFMLSCNRVCKITVTSGIKPGSGGLYIVRSFRFLHCNIAIVKNPARGLWTTNNISRRDRNSYGTRGATQCPEKNQLSERPRVSLRGAQARRTDGGRRRCDGARERGRGGIFAGYLPSKYNPYLRSTLSTIVRSGAKVRRHK